MILVNAENRVMGRLASFVAKKALEGEKVTILNAEKVIITGSRESAMHKLQTRLGLHGKGNPEKGPHSSRMPDRVLRRVVRGMLPWRRRRGKEAYRRVHVYIGLPSEFSDKEFANLPESKGRELKKFVELGEVCRLLGAKW